MKKTIPFKERLKRYTLFEGKMVESLYSSLIILYNCERYMNKVLFVVEKCI